MSKYVIPPINEPIMKTNGTMSLPWYLYLKQVGIGGDTPTPVVPTFTPPLFSIFKTDYTIEDDSLLESSAFDWISKADYEDAYQHLADDIVDKTLTSETIGVTTVQFYLADDGHKICPATEASNVADIFTATGVAWYYILDTDNEQFKLPRTTFGFVGIRNNVGDYVEPGLPNITGVYNRHSGYANIVSSNTSSGAFYFDSSDAWVGKSLHPSDGTFSVNNVKFDASRSNAIYGKTNTVQEASTQMYLYFYVGKKNQQTT